MTTPGFAVWQTLHSLRRPVHVRTHRTRPTRERHQDKPPQRTGAVTSVRVSVTSLYPSAARTKHGDSAPVIRRENFATRLDFAFDAITSTPATASAPADDHAIMKSALRSHARVQPGRGGRGAESVGASIILTVHDQNLVCRPLAGGPCRIDCTAMARAISAMLPAQSFRTRALCLCSTESASLGRTSSRYAKFTLPHSSFGRWCHARAVPRPTSALADDMQVAILQGRHAAALAGGHVQTADADLPVAILHERGLGRSAAPRVRSKVRHLTAAETERTRTAPVYRQATRPERTLFRGIVGAQAGRRPRSPAPSAAADTVATAAQRDVVGVPEAAVLRGVDGVRRWHHAHPRLVLQHSSSRAAEQQPAVHAGECPRCCMYTRLYIQPHCSSRQCGLLHMLMSHGGCTSTNHVPSAALHAP